MIAKMAKRLRSDVADSSLVTFIFILPLFFSFLVTIVDTSMYFSNRSVIQQIARDGVRQAAIFGGPGTGTTQSKLEQAYGNQALNNTTYPNCKDAEFSGRLANGNDVECQVLKRLVVNSGLTNVDIVAVDCVVGDTTGGDVRSNDKNNFANNLIRGNSNGLATTTGDVVTCQVLWDYPGIPGSALAFMQPGNASGQGYFQDTRVTAQTETSVNATSIVAR